MTRTRRTPTVRDVAAADVSVAAASVVPREEQEIGTLLGQGRAVVPLVLGELPDGERVIRAAIELGTPAVLVARPSIGGALAVTLDHPRAVTLALDHLRALGHCAVARRA